MKKISVIMSVHNSENFLERSINSILQQTYENFKFLIINDGSKDKTSSILKYFKKKDERIFVLLFTILAITHSGLLLIV